MKYSIVIPVYNTEQYLSECLDRIIEQTYTDFEVLLVDDGSFDGSAQMCDGFAKKDARIKVMHITNVGPARIRNIGIENASGDYIWFIDSDDRISNIDVLYRIDEIIRQNIVDVLFFLSEEFDQYLVQTKKKQIPYIYDGMYEKSGEQLLIELQNKNALGNVATSPVNKMFKTSLLKSNELYFVSHFRWHEEDEFISKVISKAEKIYFLNQAYYQVRVRPNSITTTINKEIVVKKILTRLELVDLCCHYFNDSGFRDDLVRAMNTYYAYYYMFGLKSYFALSDNRLKKTIRDEISKRAYIFKCMGNTESRNIRLISKVYNVLGLRITLAVIGSRYR